MAENRRQLNTILERKIARIKEQGPELLFLDAKGRIIFMTSRNAVFDENGNRFVGPEGEIIG